MTSISKQPIHMHMSLQQQPNEARQISNPTHPDQQKNNESNTSSISD
jgi:hypothetical protein